MQRHISDKKSAKGRVRISKRIVGDGEGVLVIGEERYSVPMVDFGICGMCIVAPKALEHGKQVVLEVADARSVEGYICRVAFCQQVDWGWQIGLEIVEQDSQLLVINIP